MNWEAIGGLGELLGATTVLVTLIVVVAKVRHSTRAISGSGT